MARKPSLVNYDFVNFTEDLEKTNDRHPHVVRREHATTYIDRFAFEQIENYAAILPETILGNWSRSYYTPEAHLKAVMQFGEPNLPVTAIDSTLYQKAVDDAVNGLSGLPLVVAYDVLTQLDQVPYKSSSAAGYDYQGSKGPLNGDNHKRAISRAKAVLWSAIAEDGEGIEHVIRTFVPDVGYTRTQLTDLLEKTKVRQVWGREFHYILLEGIVASPFIKAVMQTNTFIHAGKDPIFSVPALLSDVKRDCKWLYALDWKQFDATVSRFEINTAFDIIKSKVMFPNYETEQAFEIARLLFIHKKVAAPDGFIYWSHKGIPSGSYFTSVIGSIINYLRINYLWRVIKGRAPIHLYTLGDDSLVGDNDFVDPDAIEHEATKLGWHFNKTKTEISTVPESVTFLGRTSTGSLNKRDLTRCIRLLAYPEYPVESGRISAYRAQSIAYDAGELSDVLNRVAYRLRHLYGVASEDEVPLYFKQYVIENIGL